MLFGESGGASDGDAPKRGPSGVLTTEVDAGGAVTSVGDASNRVPSAVLTTEVDAGGESADAVGSVSATVSELECLCFECLVRVERYE